MRNLKVRTKILISFGICFIMTVILGITSVTSVNKMGSVANNYVEISIPATTQIWTARRGVQAVQKSAMEMMIVMSESELNALETELTEERENVVTALNELKTLTPQFADEVDKALGYLDDVATIRQQMFAECEKMTTEGNAAAYQIYKNEYEPAYEKVIDTVLTLYDDVNAAIDTRYAEAQKTTTTSIITVVAVILLCLIIVLVVTFMLSNQLTRPIIEVMIAMKAVAEGRLKDAHIQYQSKDELGKLSGTVRDTIQMLQEMIPDIANLSQKMGDGDFTVRSKNRDVYVGEYAGILEGIIHIRDTLTETVQQIDMAAGQMLSGSEQVANGAQALSQGATEQASSVEELAATIANIDDKVRLANENADVANRFTIEAGEGVKQSNVYMGELMKAMDDIQSSASEIGKIIKEIDDVAFQTNILALNAAVEAARAGAAGKGFAVVADEVRNLAGKSAEAAKTTATLIENAIHAVEVGMKSAQETSDAMKEVAVKAGVSTEKMQQISDASNEQADAIAQLKVGIDQIASVTQTTSATSEESAAASEELSSQAGFLKELTGRFSLQENIYGQKAKAEAYAEPIHAEAAPKAEVHPAYTPAPKAEVHTPAPLHDFSYDYDSKY